MNKRYSQGIMADGPAILDNGSPMSPDYIVESLNEKDEEIERQESQIEDIRLICCYVADMTPFPNYTDDIEDAMSECDAIKIAKIVQAQYAEEIARLKAENEGECEWRIDDRDNDVYTTGCDNAFIFVEGTPEENQMNYCCYCGKPISEPPTGDKP